MKRQAKQKLSQPTIFFAKTFSFLFLRVFSLCQGEEQVELSGESPLRFFCDVFQKQLELKENLGTLFLFFFQKQLELKENLGMFTATLFSLSLAAR